jgi:hypothetical protein
LPWPELGPRAIELWEGVTGKYDLRVDELFVLEAACREVDLIDAMLERQKVEDLIGVGSQGQPVAAPLGVAADAPHHARRLDEPTQAARRGRPRRRDQLRPGPPRRQPRWKRIG